MLAHPHRMAEFSAWANARVYAACASLPAAELARDRSAFFRSIVGTLNHILLVDILYRERLEGVRSQFRTLDEVLHSRLDDLTEAQRASDAYYADHTAQLDAPNLDEPIGFYTLLDDPEYWEVAQRIYFSNLFQHQIHHRRASSQHAISNRNGSARGRLHRIRSRAW